MGNSADRQAPPSDAAREAAAEIITAAYGDGQLTIEEYQERLAGVREADNAWRLERWTGDLQTPDPTWKDRLRAAAVDEKRRIVGSFGAMRSGWRRLPKVAVVVMALVFVGSMAWLISRPSPEGEDRLTSGLAEFRDAFADEFDSTEISALQIDPDHARLEVPVEDDPPRVQVWAWQHDSFSKVGKPTSTTLGVVDIADIDVEVIDDALEAALPELGLSEPSGVTTIIRASGQGQQQVTVKVSNEFQESATMVFEFDGDELGRRPFEGPEQE